MTDRLLEAMAHAGSRLYGGEVRLRMNGSPATSIGSLERIPSRISPFLLRKRIS